MQQITTAVIAVAGWGTRWLPLTKAIEKCMLPVGNRPVVDWVVVDCVAAGLTRIIFVVAEDQQQIRNYYAPNVPLETYLAAKGKDDYLQTVRQPQYDGVSFEFVVQPATGQYGTAVPVGLVSPLLGSQETFVYLYGDDLVFRPDGGSEVGDMLAHWQKTGAQSVIMGLAVAQREAPQYGVLMTDSHGTFTHIQEKPSLAELANNDRPCINLGKYVVSPDVTRRTLAYLQQPSPNANGEYYVTDLFGESAAAGHAVAVHIAKGEHLDAGTPENWLRTNQRVMASY